MALAGHPRRCETRLYAHPIRHTRERSCFVLVFFFFFFFHDQKTFVVTCADHLLKSGKSEMYFNSAAAKWAANLADSATRERIKQEEDRKMRSDFGFGQPCHGGGVLFGVGEVKFGNV